MRQVVNLYIGGEEHFIDVLPENVLDGEDKDGEHKVLDITSESLELDPRIKFIEKSNEWFNMAEMDFEDYLSFVEYVFDVEVRFKEEDIE